MAFHNNRAEINSLMETHGFRLSKGLGQNLLTDNNIIKIIADSAGITAGEIVVEVGPGLGALTSELCTRASKVIAIEIDSRIIPLLKEATASLDNLEIINIDFMNFCLTTIGEKYKLIGNLPYYITTPIIMKLVEAEKKPECMVFMIQKEVAQRIVAEPGSKVYGAISVACQYHCEVDYIADVSREVFLPKPNVDSAVIRLRPYGEKEAEKANNEALFFAIVKAGFGQRRKMLRNSLLKTGIEKEILDKAFVQVGIEPTERAEMLSSLDFISIANAIDSLK